MTVLVSTAKKRVLSIRAGDLPKQHLGYKRFCKYLIRNGGMTDVPDKIIIHQYDVLIHHKTDNIRNNKGKQSFLLPVNSTDALRKVLEKDASICLTILHVTIKKFDVAGQEGQETTISQQPRVQAVADEDGSGSGGTTTNNDTTTSGSGSTLAAPTATTASKKKKKKKKRKRSDDGSTNDTTTSGSGSSLGSTPAAATASSSKKRKVNDGATNNDTTMGDSSSTLVATPTAAAGSSKKKKKRKRKSSSSGDGAAVPSSTTKRAKMSTGTASVPNNGDGRQQATTKKTNNSKKPPPSPSQEKETAKKKKKFKHIVFTKIEARQAKTLLRHMLGLASLNVLDVPAQFMFKYIGNCYNLISKLEDVGLINSNGRYHRVDDSAAAEIDRPPIKMPRTNEEAQLIICQHLTPRAQTVFSYLLDGGYHELNKTLRVLNMDGVTFNTTIGLLRQLKLIKVVIPNNSTAEYYGLTDKVFPFGRPKVATLLRKKEKKEHKKSSSDQSPKNTAKANTKDDSRRTSSKDRTTGKGNCNSNIPPSPPQYVGPVKHYDDNYSHVSVSDSGLESESESESETESN